MIDGKPVDISAEFNPDESKIQDVDAVVDRPQARKDDRSWDRRHASSEQQPAKRSLRRGPEPGCCSRELRAATGPLRALTRTYSFSTMDGVQ
jgi:hypothetical protein